jgi:hypothetical protein
MNHLAPINADRSPSLAAAAGASASLRFLEFFAANFRHPQTPRLSAGCGAGGLRAMHIEARGARR